MSQGDPALPCNITRGPPALPYIITRTHHKGARAACGTHPADQTASVCLCASGGARVWRCVLCCTHVTFENKKKWARLETDRERAKSPLLWWRLADRHKHGLWWTENFKRGADGTAEEDADAAAAGGGGGGGLADFDDDDDGVNLARLARKERMSTEARPGPTEAREERARSLHPPRAVVLSWLLAPRGVTDWGGRCGLMPGVRSCVGCRYARRCSWLSWALRTVRPGGVLLSARWPHWLCARGKEAQ